VGVPSLAPSLARGFYREQSREPRTRHDGPPRRSTARSAEVSNRRRRASPRSVWVGSVSQPHGMLGWSGYDKSRALAPLKGGHGARRSTPDSTASLHGEDDPKTLGGAPARRTGPIDDSSGARAHSGFAVRAGRDLLSKKTAGGSTVTNVKATEHTRIAVGSDVRRSRQRSAAPVRLDASAEPRLLAGVSRRAVAAVSCGRVVVTFEVGNRPDPARLRKPCFARLGNCRGVVSQAAQSPWSCDDASMPTSLLSHR